MVEGVIAFHDESYSQTLLDVCNLYFKGEIILINNLESLISKFNGSISTPNFCFMDINLGFPNSENINPFLSIYNLFEEEIILGDCKLLGFSHNNYTVLNAEKKGLPVLSKGCNFSIYKEFFSLTSQEYVDKYLKTFSKRHEIVSNPCHFNTKSCHF